MMLVDARDLQRGDLVVERSGSPVIDPYMIIGADWWSRDNLVMLSVFIPTATGRGVLTGAGCRGDERFRVVRPDFDPVIEHQRAVFADFVAERGL